MNNSELKHQFKLCEKWNDADQWDLLGAEYFNSGPGYLLNAGFCFKRADALRAEKSAIPNLESKTPKPIALPPISRIFTDFFISIRANMRLKWFRFGIATEKSSNPRECQIVARDWEHERGVRVRINKGGMTTNRMRLFAERVIPSGTKICWNVDKRKYEYTASNDVHLYIVEEQELL